MIIRYYFDPTKNEILASYDGDNGGKGFSRFLNMGFAENKIQPGIRSIIDLRKANIIFKPGELGNITALFIKNLQKIQSGRWALIIKTPRQASIAT